MLSLQLQVLMLPLVVEPLVFEPLVVLPDEVPLSEEHAIATKPMVAKRTEMRSFIPSRMASLGLSYEKKSGIGDFLRFPRFCCVIH
jgi:hypothetical protein